MSDPDSPALLSSAPDCPATTAGGPRGQGQQRWSRCTVAAAVSLTILFILSRGFMWWVDHHIDSYWMIGTPVDYYFEGLERPDSGAMQEYPVPVMWLVSVLKWLTTVFSWTDKSTLSMWMLLVIDGGFFAWLTGTRRWWGGVFWVLFGLLFGPLLWTRWDIIPAILVAATLVAMARHPRIAGILLGCATMIKLWPAVLGTVLVGWWKSRLTWKRLFSFGITCVIILVLSIWDYGFHRITSVFNYQNDRGLQIESIPATGVMWAAHYGDQTFRIAYATSQSFEIFGPTVPRWETLSMVLTIIMFVSCIVLCFSGLCGNSGFRRVLLNRRKVSTIGTHHQICVHENTTDNVWSASRSAWLALLIIGAVVISNKVLSTQYVVWWAAPLAVCLDSVYGSPASASKRSAFLLRIAGILMLCVAGLSQWMYPFSYDALISNSPSPSVNILVARNVTILVTFFLLLAGFISEPTVRLLRLRDLSDACHRHPSGRGWINASQSRLSTYALASGVYAVVQVIVAATLSYNATLTRSSLSRAITSWDSRWFTRIAEYGYRGGEMIDGQPPEYHTVAFLPGTPWLLRCTHAMTGLSWTTSALLMNTILGVTAACVLTEIVRHFTSSQLAVVLAVAVFAGFPMSVTFIMAYSEALFSLCTFLFITGFVKQNFPLAAIGVFLACLVRVTGYDLAIAFAFGVLIQHRKDIRAWVSVILAPLGGLVYLAWASWLTRDIGGYFAVQKAGWGTQFDFGTTTLHDLPRQLFATPGVVPLWGSLAILGTGTLIGLGGARRAPLVMWLSGTGLGLSVILSSGYFHSRPRLLLMAGVLLTVSVILTTVHRWPIITTGYAIATIWVGAWLSAYMLTQWNYAI